MRHTRFAALAESVAGSMAAVQKVRDRATDAVLALKTSLSATHDSAIQREFELLSRLRHPVLPEAYECGTSSSDRQVLTETWCEGQAPVPGAAETRTALPELVGALLQALGELHREGQVHLDLKPDHLLWQPGSPPRLVDFGLCQPIGRRCEGIRGTLPYFAPELLRGEPVDERADLYSLALLVVHLGTGQLPFRHSGGNALAREKIEEGDGVVRRAVESLGAPWGPWVARLLVSDPTRRPASTTEALGELPFPVAELRRIQTAFVGREESLATLMGHLDSARRDSRGQAFSMHHPAGAGTTRFLREAVRRAQLAGHGALLLASPDDDWAARMCAGLGAWSTGAAAPSADPLDDFLVQVETRARHNQATLLALRTRQDPAATAILQQCAAAAAALPLVVLSDGMADDKSQPRLELPPFSRDEVVEISRQWLGEDVGEDLGERLHGATRGHPGFLQALLASGDPPRAAWPTSLTEMLQERAQGLNRQEKEVLDLLALTQRAIPQETIAHALCRSAADIQTVLTRLRQAALVIQRRPGQERGAQYWIATDALRDWWVSDLNEARKIQLHAAIADALAGTSDPALRLERGLHRQELGEHKEAQTDALAAARDGSLGLSLRERAYELALQHCADADAATLRVELAELLGQAGRIQQALATLACHPSSPSPELLLVRGELLGRQGRSAEAERDFRAVAEALADAGAHPIRARAHLRLARVDERRGQKQEARAQASRAQSLAPKHSDAAAAADNVMASLLLAEGEQEEAERLIQKVLEACRHSGDQVGLAGGWNNRGLLAMARDDWAGAQRAFGAGLELFAAQNDLARCATMLDNLGVATHRCGDSVGAIEAFEKGWRYRLRVGDRKRIADSHNNLGALYYTQGEHRAAQQHLRRALALRRAEELPADVSTTLNNLALVQSTLGELDLAKESLRESIAIKEELQDALGAASSRINLASILVRDGDPTGALHLIREAEVTAEAQNSAGLRLGVLEHRAQAEIVAGRPARAAASAAAAAAAADPQSARALPALLVGLDANLALHRPGELLELAAQITQLIAADPPAATLAAAVERRLAEAHLAAGDLPTAVLHCGRAWTMLRRDIGDPEEGECLRMKGEILLARGRPHEARQCLAEAVAHHQHWGSHHGLARAQLALGRAAGLCGDTQAAQEAQREAAQAFARMGNEAMALSARESLAAPQATEFVPDPIAMLRRVGGTLTQLGDPDSLLRDALTVVLETIGAERGQVLLVDPATDELVVHVARNMDPETAEDAVHHSRTILERTLSEETVLYSEDAQSDESFRDLKSVVRYKIVSFICVPMICRNRAMGTIYVDNRSVVNRFDRADADFLQVFASLAAVAVENATLTQRLRRENLELRREIRQEWELPNLVGRSPAMQRVTDLVRRAARSNSTVLLLGETGTGKELLARALHLEGERSAGPFVAVDCGALQPTLIESELFGHRRGAFSGAVVDKSGLFEEADGGTIFLDEISNLEPGLQARLLRVLQEGEVRRLGETRQRRVDVRVICASNEDLGDLVDQGRFRSDLYFRINIVPITLPPLRERYGDVDLLAAFFLEKMEKRVGRRVRSISPQVRAALLAYAWPGNVRELENTLEGMVVMSAGERLEAEDLPPWLREAGPGRAATLHTTERERLMAALEVADWIQTRAAKELGISERVLRYKMQKHGISNPRRKGRD